MIQNDNDIVQSYLITTPIFINKNIKCPRLLRNDIRSARQVLEWAMGVEQMRYIEEPAHEDANSSPKTTRATEEEIRSEYDDLAELIKAELPNDSDPETTIHYCTLAWLLGLSDGKRFIQMIQAAHIETQKHVLNSVQPVILDPTKGGLNH